MRTLASLCEQSITMRARSRSDPGAHSACQRWAVSSAIRLAVDMDTPSASEASRTKARTSSLRSGSSTSWSSENRAAEAFMDAGKISSGIDGRRRDGCYCALFLKNLCFPIALRQSHLRSAHGATTSAQPASPDKWKRVEQNLANYPREVNQNPASGRAHR